MSPAVEYLMQKIRTFEVRDRKAISSANFIFYHLGNKERVSLKVRNGHYFRVVDNRDRYQKRLSAYYDNP